MAQTAVDRTVFVMAVASEKEFANTRLLVDSIRAFGGALSHCPIWLFEANPRQAPCGAFTDLGVQVLPLAVPDSVKGYYYGHKVYACARAEELAPPKVRSLVYLAPENLILQPPLSFDLAAAFDAAVRPVHIKNVGLDAAIAPDAFWQRVFDVVGVPDVTDTVASFVDGHHIRAYYNSAAFAANPATGLLRRWFDLFQVLVGDEEFQAGPCRDDWHQVFLHQAVLSTLIATALEPARVHVLSPDYVYPYNLHASIPRARRAQVLNDLVCIFHEGRSMAPGRIDDIEIRSPLRSWLAARAGAERG